MSRSCRPSIARVVLLTIAATALGLAIPACGATGPNAPHPHKPRPDEPRPDKPRLTPASLPFLGVSCHVPNSIACDRVGIGVELVRPATRVTVELAGRRVALRRPGQGANLWLGYLTHAGLRHGPLAVRTAPHSHLWDGDPQIYL